MKLHIGCGPRNFGKDWYHIDGSEYDHIHSHNITQLPFDDETVELIYASHVLEYFDRQEVLNVLKEWKRVLKNNGKLRLAVPDFEAMAKLYVNEGLPLKRFLGPIFGKWSMKSDETIYHKTTYDYNDLKEVLETVDFKNVQRWDWRETEHAKFDDFSQAYIPHMDKENGTLISLNVECKK